MGGMMSRRKGARGEREVIDLLQPVVNEVYEACAYPDDEIPKLKRNSLQSDEGGSDVAGLPWLALEVKFYAKIENHQLMKFWVQTLRQAGMSRAPVLFYRRNSCSWSVMMTGMLGAPGWGYTVPVIVTPQDFLLWFRTRLHQEITK